MKTMVLLLSIAAGAPTIKFLFTAAMSLYTESMPDNINRVAFLYGPLVLAGQLGNQMPDPVYGIPVIINGQ